MGADWGVLSSGLSQLENCTIESDSLVSPEDSA